LRRPCRRCELSKRCNDAACCLLPAPELHDNTTTVRLCLRQPHLSTWCTGASGMSGRAPGCAGAAGGPGPGGRPAALLRALRHTCASRPAAWGKELCVRIAHAAVRPESAKAAARALEARRLGGPIFGCCNAGCSNFEGESELVLGRACQLCSGCLAARYCSAACQRAAWDAHRAFCKAARRACPAPQ